jgi:hypothetical protein
MRLAVLCTDGLLNLQDIKNECKTQKWFPIFMYRDKEETFVPLFNDNQTVISFIKRSMPPNWAKGRIELTDEDINWIKNKGWKIREMTYPHKVDKFEMGFEILQLSEEPDLITSYLYEQKTKY